MIRKMELCRYCEKKGDNVTEGDELGFVRNPIVRHSIMVPVGFSGVVLQIANGNYTIDDVIAKIKTDKEEKILLWFKNVQ